MKTALDTLFLPLEKELLPRPARASRVLFLNAHIHPALRNFQNTELHCQQFYKPYAERLERGGIQVSPDVPENAALYDFALAFIPKNKTEAHYMMATGLSRLKTGGYFLCAAANKTAGRQLEKMLRNLGCGQVQTASKNKARAAWAKKNSPDEKALNTALEAGNLQEILDGEYISRPGIYGWDKIDQGSRILLQHMPKTLSGRGADFGCGYGYLSCNILRNNPHIEAFYCIDADYRAMHACRLNIEACKPESRIEYLWENLAAARPAVRDLDFIVMNPPFHEGKKADPALGQVFIKTAANALKPGGTLWMVANIHLPYEAALEAEFTKSENIFERGGFKGFRAVR